MLDCSSVSFIEGVIEQFSHRDDRASWIVSTFVVGDCNDETLDQETQQLVDAIELETVDDTGWEEAFEEYVDGIGYTTLNRLAALYGGPGVR